MAEEEGKEIYIRVTGEQGAAWRPVRAVPLGDDVFRIISQPEQGSPEKWQFAPGSIVRCKPFELTDHDLVLVAYEAAGEKA